MTTLANESPRVLPPPAVPHYYLCGECGWHGTEGQMEADALVGADGWCNTICPSCGIWQDLADYIDAGPTLDS